MQVSMKTKLKKLSNAAQVQHFDTRTVKREIGRLGFNLSQATKALGESRGIALLYFRPLHQKGVRGQRHAPAALYPRERPGTHCTGGWVGLRAGLDWCVKISPHRDSIPGPSSPQAVAIPTELPGPRGEIEYRFIELPVTVRIVS